MKTPTFASTILGTTLLILCNIGHSADLNRDSGKCIAERTKLLAQDIDTFDQSPEGWRSVAANNPEFRTVLAVMQLLVHLPLAHFK